ncbi:MAG: Acetyl-CoA acetyltransferase [Candidatus Alkanophagales archaeon MCA70_species_2]|nr:Acetyl-CoA acetyltransferase [Candidatus Alkanophaga liquidiphilum]RLG37936.1 MAG: acetyl-CoA acetyltransferase [Candidatus Alkanophagales archaeon]
MIGMGRITDKVAIVGTGVTKFGEIWEKDHEDLLVEAVYEACNEANVDLRKDVEAAWVGTFWTFSGVAGDAFADPLKWYGKPITRVENYCATGMDAVRNAAYAVASGVYDIVIAAGVEKILDQGSRGLPDLDKMLLGAEVTLNAESAPAMFAMAAVRAFKEWGWTKEDLALVAVKNHYNGARHPKAHFRREITVEMALKAPMIAYPLGLFDCCAMSDGAAAVVLTRPEIAKELVGDEYATIKAMGLAVETLHPFYRKDWTGLAFPANVKAAEMAYKEAGITDPRKELDFGIVHDCFTITELINYQDMKLCKLGEGAQLIRDGVTTIEGDFPINPDGGLKCFGHPIGATGCRMVAELTRQVLGRAEGLQVKDAEAGFAHNLGGPQAVAIVGIVGRPDWKPGEK